MKISCIEPLGISKEQFEALRSQFESQGHSFEYYMNRCEDEATLIERMKDSDVAILSNIKISSAVLQECTRLKYISVAFTGLDHIDLDYCKQHNITVQNAAGYSTVAVSELTIGLMLDLMRHITVLDAATRQGGSRNNFLGSELHGKTVGVVGTGAIGTATIRLLKAFGCNVIAYNRSHHAEVEALGVKYMPLHELLPQCDIVTLHVPLTSDTHHLIGAKELSLMKKNALLINTARGNVVDMDAAATALKNGTLAGMATDVYEKEPPLQTSHALLNAPNCICVPHIGFATREAFDIRADIVMEHVRQWLNQQ